MTDRRHREPSAICARCSVHKARACASPLEGRQRLRRSERGRRRSQQRSLHPNSRNRSMFRLDPVLRARDAGPGRTPVRPPAGESPRDGTTGMAKAWRLGLTSDRVRLPLVHDHHSGSLRGGTNHLTAEADADELRREGLAARQGRALP